MKLIKIVVLFIFVVGAFDAFAQPDVYVGVDSHYRQTDFKKGWGANLFNTKHHQTHVFAGLRATEFLAFELGNVLTNTYTKHVTIFGEEKVLGISATNTPEHHCVKSTVRGFTTGALWFLPFRMFSDSLDKFEGLLYTGISLVKTKYQDMILADSGGPLDVKSSTRTFISRGGIFRTAIGVQYVENKIGIRFMAGIDNTRMFKNVMPEEPSAKRLRLKDTYFGGIGFFVRYP